MYKYEYETVSCELGGWGFGSGNIYDIGDYRPIIDKRASEGWRYVGYIPTKQRGTGHIQEIDLIFEKEVSQLNSDWRNNNEKVHKMRCNSKR